MSISGIVGQAATLSAILGNPSGASSGSNLAALAAVASGSGDGGVVANVDVAANVVSTALQDIDSALGSIIDVTA